MQKRCSRCKITKQDSEFYKSLAWKSKGNLSSHCKQCTLEKQREARQKDPERFRAINRKATRKFYYVHLEECREKNRKYTAEYAKKHPDRVKANLKRYETTLKAKIRQKRYSGTDKCKARWARGRHKRRTREKAIPCTLTAHEWQEILWAYHNRCAYCSVEFSPEIPPTKDHVIPVSKGGGLTKDNIVPACKSCNSRKNSRLQVA